MLILFLGHFYQEKLSRLGSGSISQISNPHQIQPTDKGRPFESRSCRIAFHDFL